MKDKLVWQYLMPLMLRIPILKKLAMRLYNRQLVKLFAESIDNYKKALDRMKNSELAGNPFYDIASGMSAVMALMPAAMIYGYVKESQEVKTDDSQVSANPLPKITSPYSKDEPTTYPGTSIKCFDGENLNLGDTQVN